MKHVLFLFLSPFSGKDAYYKDIEREDEPTKFTNESALRWIIKHELNGDAAQLSRVFILASKMVQSPMKDDPRTHLEFFIERAKMFAPAVEEIIYDYDENGAGDQNLMSVARIAEGIQQYAREVGDDVTLHADLSGGMRPVNMIMLDVVRLLEYSGIKIGCLLYSNLQNKIVEPLDDIYALLQLTAGVEEFIQFGSVKALNDYYDAQDQSRLSDGLNRLRAAMENFSEQIKLCHYGQFERAIKNLHDAVHDFKPSDDNAQDLLMARLIDRIREMYAGTIKDRLVDDVELIRWCVKNDYVQQALTLYTERVPEYIGEHGWLVLSLEELKKLDERVTDDKFHRNRWFYFLNEYPSSASDDKDRSLGLKPYTGAIKDKALNAIRKNNFDYDEWWSGVDAQLKERDLTCLDEPRLRSQLELLQKLRAEPSPLMTLDDPMLEPIRKLIDALTSELAEMPKPKLRFNRILNFISMELKGEKLFEYFPNIAARPSAPFKVLLSQNVFSLRIDQEKFLSIMDKYLRLKKERNQTNHAREDSGEFITAIALKDFINVGLDELSEVSNRR
ncbi:MAG: TM1812 family CRISPR-associated protein [Selenomonadaceae bacterium]|nr:TM1812 family CRISPR-associated protein [Selenomonadaceae bacterium]